jgi:hypothetical protein
MTAASVIMNGTGNNSCYDAIKDGLAPTEYAQIEDSLADDELLYWPDVKVPNLGIRTVHEPDLDAGRWLTDYIIYATKRSPMSPAIFHEANGLFLLSAAVARRVALKSTAGNIYPNLYIILVGPPGIIHKTGSINVADDLANAASLLRLPGIGTTEGLGIELSTTKQYNGLDKNSDPEEYESWSKERALAGQRSLITREASKLFESGKKDYMAQFRELLLEMYDCPDNLAFGLTVSRGRATAKNIFLSFLGDTTPAAMRGYFTRNAREWTDGTFSRFSLLTFENRPAYEYFLNGNGENEVSPGDLAIRLRSLHYDKLPLPQVQIVPIEMNSEGEDIKVRLDVSPITEKSVTLGTGVLEAMIRHHKAIDEACWQAYGRQDEKLASLYVRLNITTIKIAMLLATADWADSKGISGIVIQLKHWERAQWISERWRRSLHRVDSLISRDAQLSDDPHQKEESTTRKDAQKILEFLKQERQCDNRSLQRKFSGMKNGRYSEAINYLKAEGLIIQIDIQRERGKPALAYKVK